MDRLFCAAAAIIIGFSFADDNADNHESFAKVDSAYRAYPLDSLKSRAEPAPLQPVELPSLEVLSSGVNPRYPNPF